MPLVGGGGIDTFMNRAFALPSTGIGVSSPESVADRLINRAALSLGRRRRAQDQIFDLKVMVADPQPQQPRVITRPFERGVGAGLMATVPVEIGGLRGFHTLRFAYSNARLRPRRQPEAIARSRLDQKGLLVRLYAINGIDASETNPKLGWGLFLATLSDQSIRSDGACSSVLRNNLMTGHEDDLWERRLLPLRADPAAPFGLAARSIVAAKAASGLL
jgi:porin